MMASPVPTPDEIHKDKSVKKTEISSLVTATVSSINAHSSITTTLSLIVIDNTKWEDLFDIEILNFKNESVNNPLFTLQRYNDTIDLIKMRNDNAIATKLIKKFAY